MNKLELNIRYGKNEGLCISPSQLLSRYFLGISLTDKQGNRISDKDIAFYIRSAQQEIENYLNIKMIPQVIEETKDFVREDWHKWGFIRTTYPVRKPHALDGYINEVRQIQYPKDWLVTKRGNDKINYRRSIHIVAAHASTTNQNVVLFSGITPHLGLSGYNHIPNYWKIVYCTGFDVLPPDLVNFIGKLAAINIFHVMGDLILGAGIAAQSIGIDGLSQSISTTSSATNAGYGARIIGYHTDLKESLPRIKNTYKGFTVTAM